MQWVYDRTQSDIDLVIELNNKYINGTITEEEKAQWLSGMKGALNASDLSRIESNTASIAGLLKLTLLTKNWSRENIPRESDFLRIRNNVQSLREAWSIPSSVPATPTQPLNTFQKWNDIERILYEIYLSYEKTTSNFAICGSEIYAGEGIGVI